jgi:hypothetical protein
MVAAPIQLVSAQSGSTESKAVQCLVKKQPEEVRKLVRGLNDGSMVLHDPKTYNEPTPENDVSWGLLMMILKNCDELPFGTRFNLTRLDAEFRRLDPQTLGEKS